MSSSLWPYGLYSPWNSPGQNTGVGSLSLLQGIFPTQGSNPGLPRCRWVRYQLSHKGSQRILEWVAYPFSKGSSRPRNWTKVSCIAGGFFTNQKTVYVRVYSFLKSLYWLCYNIASVLCFGFAGPKTWGILVPWQGMEPSLPTLEGEALIPGQLRKSFGFTLGVFFFGQMYNDMHSSLWYHM